MAKLELLLSRDVRKDPNAKIYMETRLDVQVQELQDRISQEFSLENTKLILSGKTLHPGKRLDEQGVKNKSKIMVMVTNTREREKILKDEEEIRMKLEEKNMKEQEEKKKLEEEKKQQQEKKKKQEKSFQRTKKGFQILSERDGSEDPLTTPFLEIADQKGNPLQIPPQERKALILAMGFHEKGRSLMKRRQYDDAVCHLLKADEEFRRCDWALLISVDNYAVLQLDILWCYQVQETLSSLADAKDRLYIAAFCFRHCYGEQHERLLKIKGNIGREQVLLLRLYLLQSRLSLIEGNNNEAQEKLSAVETLYSFMCPGAENMADLMAQGFSEREARLGLRACGGDLKEAAAHIAKHRLEQEELKQRDREKRRRRSMENISSFTELGSSSRSRRDIPSAAQLHRLPVFPLFTSFSRASTSTEDKELVNEVLEDISPHEEDYLDLKLDEEKELMDVMRSQLSRGSAQ